MSRAMKPAARHWVMRSLLGVATAMVVGVVSFILVARADRARPGESAVPHNHGLRHIDPATSCGPVSLAIASHLLERPATLERCNESTKAGELGVCSMADLVRAAPEVGLFGIAVRLDAESAARLRLPMILFVDGHHFLTAYPAQEDRVILIDSPSEPAQSSWAEVGSRWNGEAVVIGPNEREVQQGLSRARVVRPLP